MTLLISYVVDGQIRGENYIYIIFKNLNCKNTSRFENFAKIAPCRQLLGRQGTCRPSSWRQGAICKNPGGGGDLPPTGWAAGPPLYISPPQPLEAHLKPAKSRKKEER